MSHNRRQFLRTAALAGGAAVAAAAPARAARAPETGPAAGPGVLSGAAQGAAKGAAPQAPAARAPKAGATKAMKLTWRPFTAQLRNVFTIATSSRSTTPIVLVEVEYDGVTGYGEASMPPYLGESQESAIAFLSRVDLARYRNPFELETILADIDAITAHNTAAKAAIDIALHDLVGKLMGQPWYNVWGFDPAKTPYTSFTIGIDTPDVVRQKTREASVYKVLKVKLGRDTDRQMIETIRSVTDVPITSDVNQGWTDKRVALDMIGWLKEKGVVFVEQPLPKHMLDDLAWLTERSPLPIIGDESVQRLTDIPKMKGVFSGINIKLMK